MTRTSCGPIWQRKAYRVERDKSEADFISKLDELTER